MTDTRTFDEWRELYCQEYPHQRTKMQKQPNSLNKEVELFRDRKLAQAAVQKLRDKE